MCSDTPAVSIKGVSKYFEIYAKPRHRLLQMLCRGRRKFYQEYWALRSISFEVNRGECLGIVGRNGAGKSTLLQILAGTLSPSSGEVLINGRVAALLELGSGFNPEFIGRENVMLNGTILGLSEKEVMQRFDAIAAFADIGEFIEQPVKTYSSGMTLRLAFAVMAHVDADVLIIDEALAVGDAFFTQKCMRFLREFMKEKTVIFVSHDTTAVCSLCTCALFLQDGCVAVMGSPRDVTKKYLEELYRQQQGDIAFAPSVSIESTCDTEWDYRDMRADIFNGSTLRNDIEVFRFAPDGISFGSGNAIIESVWLSDESGNPLQWIVGGERVCLNIRCKAFKLISRPIVGFIVFNRFGQELFGDNTYLVYKDKKFIVNPQQIFQANFLFRMPVLAHGEYNITVAIAEGTQEKHVQHHYMHEALFFVSHSSSCASGIIGIPMKNISMYNI